MGATPTRRNDQGPTLSTTMKNEPNVPYSGRESLRVADGTPARSAVLMREDNCSPLTAHYSLIQEDGSPLTAHRSPIQDRPIRVVAFGGGPVLERGIKQFLCRLEEHPDIEFLGAFCQSQAQNVSAVILDLWRRRRFLALPVLFLQIVTGVSRFLMRPRAEIKLQRKLAELSDRLHFVPDIHADTVLERVRSLRPDLGLIYGSPILKPKLFDIPRFGTLGIHHGKVPEYRGKKTTFWAMYNGEETAGVTIQKINAGLDTGEIVKAGEVRIPGNSYAKVWRELEQLGLALYIQAIIEIKRGEANFHAQQGKKGKLYRDPALGDLMRFWCRRWNRQRPLTAQTQR